MLNLGYAVPLSLEEKMWRLENDPAWTMIDLPVERGSDAREEVLVEKIGENRFRIASSPGMLQGLAADDVIALDDQAAAGFTLLQRGDNVRIHVYCEAARRDEIKAALTQTLGRIGGRLDAIMGQTGLCSPFPFWRVFWPSKARCGVSWARNGRTRTCWTRKPTPRSTGG